MKTLKIILLIAVFLISANIVLATDFISLNSFAYNISQSVINSGIKLTKFDDNFIFQLESGSLNSECSLGLKELVLPVDSKYQTPVGKKLASNIYEYDLKSLTGQTLSKDVWFSIKYQDNAFRKAMHYFDEGKNEWKQLPSTIRDYESKIISHFPLGFVKVAILEDVVVMSEGTASWYAYKGCDCAASPDYPKGTKLLVTNLDDPSKQLVVTVNDFGPERDLFPDRVIDLDVVAFEKLAPKWKGLIPVSVVPYVE